MFKVCRNTGGAFFWYLTAVLIAFLPPSSSHEYRAASEKWSRRSIAFRPAAGRMLSLHSFIRTTRRPVVRVKVTVVRTPTWSCARRRVGAGVDAVVDADVAVVVVDDDDDDDFVAACVAVAVAAVAGRVDSVVAGGVVAASSGCKSRNKMVRLLFFFFLFLFFPQRILARRR